MGDSGISRSSGTQPYQRLVPCVNINGHKFTVSYPPAGQWGYTQVVCERCGMTRSEAQRG